MHEIEPFYQWRDEYIASADMRSPFYNIEYSELYFDKQIYNFLLHPQWDEFGSSTLYLKVLYADYEQHFTVIEFIGEWNDALYNDIMLLKREILEQMMDQGINKFILIGENVLNFHSSDDSYYEEWYQEVDEGWIVGVNFNDHVIQESRQHGIDYYINFGGELDDFNWRKLKPLEFYKKMEQILSRRLN